MCAIAGVAPDSDAVSPRCVYIMMESVLQSQWNQTAQLLTVIHNAAGPKRPVKFENYYPFKLGAPRMKTKEECTAMLMGMRDICKNTKGKY